MVEVIQEMKETIRRVTDELAGAAMQTHEFCAARQNSAFFAGRWVWNDE